MSHSRSAVTLGGTWTILTLLYIAPLTNDELRNTNLDDLDDYVGTTYTLATTYDPGGLRRAQVGLAALVRGRYSMVEAGRYQLARSRTVALLARARGVAHPVDAVPDAVWAN